MQKKIRNCPGRFTTIYVQNKRETISVNSIDGIIHGQVFKLLEPPAFVEQHCRSVGCKNMKVDSFAKVSFWCGEVRQ